MLRPLLSYLTIVFLFGSLIGWSNSLNSEYPPLYHFKSAYVIMALIWGSIFFAPIILTLKASKKTKLFAIVSLSFTAGAFTYFFFSQFGQGEITQNISAGWGQDRSTYKEYPIKGYELIGLVICILYLFLGLTNWTIKET